MITLDQADDRMVYLDGVQKHYGDTIALHKTTLTVRRGEFLSILGPSGSGKTTLLNIVSGMNSPSEGRVWIDGKDVTSTPSSKRGIGMVFQNYALMPHMTVFRNVAFPLEIRRVPRDEIKRRVTEVLDLVCLPHVADRKPQELSGGQQQRISLARCLVYNPSLILMDEPLGALDKRLREQMQLEIKRIHTASGITMIYVTHDQDEALSMSDRIMLMNAGKIEQIGSPSEMYTFPVSRFAAEFLGQSSIIEGTINDAGEMRLAGGGSARVEHIGGSRSGFLLLRPERVTLAKANLEQQGLNTLEGVVVDSLVTGGVVKHFLRLADGNTLIIQELANDRRTTLTPGESAVAIWPDAAGHFLER